MPETHGTTESPQPVDDLATGPVAPFPPPPAPAVVSDRPNRLYRTAAWVAIVAGTLFIVATVFFTGFFLGRHSGGGWHYGGDRHHGGGGWHSQHRPSGPMGQLGPGQLGPGQMGPGQMGPGQMGPGEMGPGQRGPGQ
jgi:hypothetical protein